MRDRFIDKFEDSQRGSIFIFSLTAMLVLMVLGVLSIQVAIQSVNRASHTKDSSVALNLAEAGADEGEAWLRDQSVPPTDDHYIGPITLGDGTYQVKIVSDIGNDAAWLKSYTVISTGTLAGGQSTRRVIMKLQQQSFALYSYFTNQEVSSVSGSTIWFYSGDRVRGPVHTNDRFSLAWSSSATDPIFYDTVSSRLTNTQWNPRAPSTANEWRKVFYGGRDAFTTGVDRIPLPSSSELQKIAAWGGSSGFPGTDGVYLPNNGSQVSAGIYVRGNNTVTFSVESGTGNQLIAIKVGTNTTNIKVDLSGNQTIVTPPSGSPTTYTGTPNGVIYSTGSITSLKGTLANNYENGSTILARNAWTIATDVNSGKDITITDNLTYQTQPDSTQSRTALCNLRAATLGLVSEDVVLASGAPTNLTINGVMLAGSETTTNGTFYNSTWNTTLKGTLSVLGGIIQKKRGPVGTFSGTTLTSGYRKDYNYDTRMVYAPPPYYPTTGQYDIKSWQYE
jgi:hypothetical protein